MMKIFTLVKRITASVRISTVINNVTVICCIATTTTVRKNYNNDSATAGSFAFLHIPLSSTNKNLFMKTLFQCFKKSGLVLFLIFVATLFAVQSFGQVSQTFSTPGTFANGFIVPAGVTSITVQCWGGGGGGGTDAGNNNGGPGGGGGAYASSVLTVTPGQVISVTVGAGGAATVAGGQSSFGIFVIALGGGSSTTSTAGTGGQASGSIGDIKFSGGNGGVGSGGTTGVGGSGGGSSASASGNGVNGSNFSGATGGAGGNGPDGDGGAGGNNGVSGGAVAGTAPGGGGGGRGDNGGTSASGAAGQVRITWTCPTATISYDFSSFCRSVTSATSTLTGVTGGTFSSTPGLTINSLTGEINPSTSTAGTYTVSYQLAGGGGCSAINATALVTINGTPVTAVTGQSDISCFAGSDGSVTISVTGGTSPYFYSVDNGASWTPATHASPYTYGGLVANTQYRIKVKDSNGCLS
ncbi:MAG TPA: SprB repeat-containing protein, partial [Chitinophagaceae bacterium]